MHFTCFNYHFNFLNTLFPDWLGILLFIDSGNRRKKTVNEECRYDVIVSRKTLYESAVPSKA